MSVEMQKCIYNWGEKKQNMVFMCSCLSEMCEDFDMQKESRC